jgi:hypothetical protein
VGSIRRLAIAALFAAASPAAAESNLFPELDANKDGFVDLAEVQAAASAAFARAMEASPSELVSKEKQDRFRQKFQAAVERWFKLADVDGDGKLDEKELEGPAGQKLEKLLSR